MKPESISSMFYRIQSRMRAMGLSILKHSDETDDAIQETFCRIWIQRDKIADTESAEYLALTIFRNICIDSVRKNKIRDNIRLAEISQADEPTDNTQELEEISILYQEIIDIINSDLTTVQQQIIRMRDIENQPYSEIARTLKMEEATVRVNLSRARKSVRNIYLKHRL